MYRPSPFVLEHLLPHLLLHSSQRRGTVRGSISILPGLLWFPADLQACYKNNNIFVAGPRSLQTADHLFSPHSPVGQWTVGSGQWAQTSGPRHSLITHYYFQTIQSTVDCLLSLPFYLDSGLSTLDSRPTSHSLLLRPNSFAIRLQLLDFPPYLLLIRVRPRLSFDLPIQLDPLLGAPCP